MNPQLERLFHSVRRGIEANVRSALKNMEVPSKRDFSVLKNRIEHIRKGDLAHLRKKMDEIKKSLNKIEALKPYISAIEVATGRYRASPKRKTAKSKKRPTSRKVKKTATSR